MKLTTFTFTAANGTPFLVRLIRKGDPCAREMCRTHDHDEPIVEFNDTRYPFCYAFIGTKADAIAAAAPCLGQFTGGGYFLSTLRETRHRHSGLALNGDSAAWCVDPASLQAVHAWLDTVAPTAPVIVAPDPGETAAFERYCRVNGDPDNLGAGAWADE